MHSNICSSGDFGARYDTLSGAMMQAAAGNVVMQDLTLNVESENVRDHLSYLQSAIEDKLLSLLKSGKAREAQISIILTANSKDGYSTSELDLSSEDINIIQSLGVGLNVSILY